MYKWPYEFHQRTPKPDKQLQHSSWYKINSTKSVVFLYTKDKQDEKEIRETTPFKIVTNNIKYIGVTLTNEVKDLYDKNFKSLKKEIKKISEDGKISHAHGLAGSTL